MSQAAADVSMALFCDFENIALGVRDAQYEKFDIKPVLERLLLKGSIVVKKAYCDWDRYKSFKATMHEANFELIEIPHVRQSGKNSADIRMVVDALDLCYTKSHVNTFVIISGDSDFSPLVSKLRENNKRVIGVGVKQSTSDLLIANCDEFIYVDDLVHRRQRDNPDKQSRRPSVAAEPQEQEARRIKGLDLAAAMLDAMLEDRSDDERVWASVLKEAIKRRNPGFNESYFGYKTFGAMLEDAHKRGLLEFGRDERSSAYVKRRTAATPPASEPEAAVAVPLAPTFFEASATAPVATSAATEVEPMAFEPPASGIPAAEIPAAEPSTEPSRRRRSRTRPKKVGAIESSPAPRVTPDVVVIEAAPAEAAPKAVKKPRVSRPRKPKASGET